MDCLVSFSFSASVYNLFFVTFFFLRRPHRQSFVRFLGMCVRFVPVVLSQPCISFCFTEFGKPVVAVNTSQFLQEVDTVKGLIRCFYLTTVWRPESYGHDMDTKVVILNDFWMVKIYCSNDLAYLQTCYCYFNIRNPRLQKYEPVSFSWDKYGTSVTSPVCQTVLRNTLD